MSGGLSQTRVNQDIYYAQSLASLCEFVKAEINRLVNLFPYNLTTTCNTSKLLNSWSIKPKPKLFNGSNTIKALPSNVWELRWWLESKEELLKALTRCDKSERKHYSWFILVYKKTLFICSFRRIWLHRLETELRCCDRIVARIVCYDAASCATK